MTVKTILACLSSKDHARDILATAVPLARQHRAHLIGLRTPQQLMVYPTVAVYIPDSVEIEFLASEKQLTEELEAIFHEATQADDFGAEYRVIPPPVPVPERMAQAAYTADLVVMAQDARSDDAPDFEDIEEAVIRRSGRPVLMIPNGFEPGRPFGHNVVIGWSATREAARAVHDAIPLLMPDAKVAIVTVAKEDEERSQSANDLAGMLARYGFDVDVEHRQSGDLSVADILKREALERGADLMVTGAFGHSRVYDFVIGAVTIDLMRTAEIPVLFSR